MPSVTVVIPAWNHYDLLRSCLRSLQSQTIRDIEVIVVDDGSTEWNPTTVHQEFPDVQVIRLERNQGFARAANAGIRQASASLIFLLNNDVTMEPECLHYLVQAAQREPSKVAMFAPLVVCQDDPQRIFCAGDALASNGRASPLAHGQLHATFSPRQEIFAVSACAALYRKKLFDTIGAFDETFVAYLEDIDLSFRAQLAGFQARLVPEAIAYHKGSASLEGRHLWRAQQCARNHLALVLKNMPVQLLLRYAPSIIWERFHHRKRVFAVARTNYGLMRALYASLENIWDTFCILPQVLHERKRIQKMRQVTITELEQLFQKHTTQLNQPDCQTT